jgi:hypothetical protein
MNTIKNNIADKNLFPDFQQNNFLLRKKSQDGGNKIGYFSVYRVQKKIV